jgi:Tol biopolymer transport system component
MVALPAHDDDVPFMTTWGRCAVLAALLLSACAAGQPPASSVPESPLQSPSLGPSGGAPAFEGRIVFARNGGQYGENGTETLFTANADGTGEQRLTDFGQGCCPSATRDGTRILFPITAADGRITTAIVNFDGSDRFVVPLPSGTLNLGAGPFSPDGRQIAFEGFEFEGETLAGIYIGNADGTDLVRITEDGIPGDWSPDATRLVYFRPDGEAPGPGSLWVVNVDGSEAHQITTGVNVACCTNYRWSPDGSRILFADDVGVLWTIAPDGSGREQLFIDEVVQHARRFAATPTWSPDGTKVMFVLATRLNPTSEPMSGLYVIDADGSGLTLVIGGSESKAEPYWVP